jgi:hypothetical protein
MKEPMKALAKNYLLVAGLATPLMMATGAFADAPFMNIAFDGDPIGQPPATNTTTTLPITQPYSLGGYGPLTTNPYGDSPPTPSDGTVLVENTGTMTAAVLTSNSTNDQEGAVYMDTQYSVLSQFVQESFDLEILNQPPAATIQPVTLNGGPDVGGIIFGVNNFQAGNPGFDFDVVPTGASNGVFGIRTADGNGVTSFFNYSDNTVYHIQLDADYSADTVDAYVNGNLEETGDPMRSGVVANANPDETFIYLNAEPGYANSVAIDNIQASVPEPASISLLGMGALALLKRRHTPAKT